MSAILTPWGLTTAPGSIPADQARRAKADASAQAAERDALPPYVKTWADILPFDEQKALAAVGTIWARAGGGNGVSISRAELAAYLITTPDEAGRLLDRLVEAGAVIRTNRLTDSPVFKPAAWASAPAKDAPSQKSDIPSGETAMSRAFATARLAAGLGLRAR